MTHDISIMNETKHSTNNKKINIRKHALPLDFGDLPPNYDNMSYAMTCDNIFLYKKWSKTSESFNEKTSKSGCKPRETAENILHCKNKIDDFQKTNKNIDLTAVTVELEGDKGVEAEKTKTAVKNYLNGRKHQKTPLQNTLSNTQKTANVEKISQTSLM